MSNEIQLQGDCPTCGEEVVLTADVPEATAKTVRNRARIQPSYSVDVFKISSNDIHKFIAEKVNKFSEGTLVDVRPVFHEKVNKSDPDKNKRYAYLLVAFSSSILVQNDNTASYVQKLIASNSNNQVRVIPEIKKYLINKYSFNTKTLYEWINNYKLGAKVEEKLGIDSDFIKIMIKESKLHLLPTASDQDDWFMFAVDPGNVIRDMLESVDSKSFEGALSMDNVVKISDTAIEYTVSIHPNNSGAQVNPLVRYLMKSSK